MPLRPTDYRATHSTISGGAVLAGMSLFFALGAAAPVLSAKDTGPTNAICDQHNRASAEWQTCTAALALSGDDAQLYYAGYWLAKNERYHEALAVLAKVKSVDAAVLTYRGFATRKLGDPKAALVLYRQALKIDPMNAVTRAYMGEAYLSLGRDDAARAELNQIASICGSGCEPYKELATAISKH
ncbi:MAG: tetratricopeptide repeat protein [Pseudomonadota bacterium]